MTGVLSFTPNKPDSFLSMDDKNLLTAIAWQVAVFLEQEAYKDRARESERLKESERLYQTILDSISHEIKTPLTAIMGLASVLNGGEIRDEKSRARLLDELSESSERLNREVGNILDMSRLSSGIINLKREWTDVREIIESSLGKLEKYVKDHTVRVSVPDDIPFVRVDFTLFESAVTNLLLNAAKYTPAGSAIEVSVRAADGKILLTVADNGPGLAADQLVSVFEKFYRVPGTPSGGTGLGLSIAKSVVELHGGAITAQDRPQGGLEIVISLPLERQPDLGEQ
jgi:two-component system sensor histidine kinase KdpD